MYDPNLNIEVQAFALYLEKSGKNRLPTSKYDLVLDIINKEKDKIIWAYYYVDHDSKTLFWQDPYDCGDSLLSEVRGVQEASHVSAYFQLPVNTVRDNDVSQSSDSSPSIGENFDIRYLTMLI